MRPVSHIEYQQYPLGDPLPSAYSSWVGQYFDSEALAGPATSVRADSSLNFAWAGAAPVAGLNGARFSARWTRMLALSEGEYPFSVAAVGGVRVWIDGKLEIDGWDAPSNALREHAKTVTLLSGLHRVEIDYANRGGFGQIRFGNLPPNAPVIINAQDEGNADIAADRHCAGSTPAIRIRAASANRANSSPHSGAPMAIASQAAG